MRQRRFRIAELERATPEQQVRGGELSQHGSLTALPRVETTGKQEVERFLLAS